MHRSIRFAMLLVYGPFMLGCMGDGPTDEDASSDTGFVDDDKDGVAADLDCDDADASLGAREEDGDCDGLETTEDCDDADPASTAVADDADCDGSLRAEDCDDKDPSLDVHDLDADGVTTCDGDCDDEDAAVLPGAIELPGNGTDENCDEADTANLVLNELQYDPAGGTPAAPGLGGDANYDGIRESQGDEFVELVNVGDFTVDISGFQLFDQENLDARDDKGGPPNHVVAAGTLLGPMEVLVVFGGGTPGVDGRKLLADDKTPNPDFGMPTFDFDGAIVQTSTFGELNLNNGGDAFYLEDSFGNPVLAQDLKALPNYTSAADQSYTRVPDLTGAFDLHTATDAKVLFSPGTRADGSAF